MTRAWSRDARCAVLAHLVALAVGVVGGVATDAQAQPLRKIGELQLRVLGVTASIDPAHPTVPKHVASGVRVVLRAGGEPVTPATAAQLLGAFAVEGELAGPGLGEPVTLRRVVDPADGATDLLLPLPALAIAGDYALSNLRLVAGGRPVLDVSPSTVPIQVIDQVLVTSVRTRPLSLQEIQDKGIVLDRDDYLGFEFTLGLRLESRAVQVSFPVVFDSHDVPVPTPLSTPAIDVQGLRVPVAVPTIVPLMLKVPPAIAAQIALDGTADVKIPSVLVIPGDVGYLRQFFSAQLFVANGAPGTSALVVRDVTGTIDLPKGLDLELGTADDPLSLAETVRGIQPETMAVRGVGPDGLPETADDVAVLRPGEQGQAEFLVRGDLEGFHALAFDLAATLEGLPIGPVPVSGRALGGVLVRNPFFDVSFTVPSVVRQDEPFTLYATVTNTGQGVANAVTMALDAARLSGARLVGATSQSIDTIAPGDAQTLAFAFVAERTGQVVASYLRFDGPGATGTLAFSLGVGERGIALSPDTLVLPAPVAALPETVVRAAMRVLGQAWSVANTPPNARPAGVLPMSKAVVTEKALALAEAGLRTTLGQPPLDALRDLIPDYFGGAPLSPGFDQLLRTTDAGRGFVAAVGAALAPAVAEAGSVGAVERAFAEVAVSGPDVVSFSTLAPDGATITLRDGAGRRSVARAPDAQVVSAALVPLGTTTGAPVFGVVASPAVAPYTLEITGAAGTTDVSVTVPRGDGTCQRALAQGVALTATERAWVTLAPGSAPLTLEIDADGDGTADRTVAFATETIAPSAPTLLSASVIGPETLPSAGPFGLHAALLFDRVVDATRSADTARYAIPQNRVLSAKRQLSGRLVFASLAQPEGPNVPTTLAVTGMADGRGTETGRQERPLVSRLLDPGAVVSGHVRHGDGTPAAGLRVVYQTNPDWRTCQPQTLPGFAAVETDARGAYAYRYVRRDPCGLSWRMVAADPVTGAARSVSGMVRAAGERLVADLTLLGRGAVTGVVRTLAGTVAPGARVTAVSLADPQSGGTAVADGEGRFTIAPVSVGPVSVKAVAGTAVGSASGQIARAGTTAQVDVTLNSGAVTIQGTVRRLEGGVLSPAAGVVVTYTLQIPEIGARVVGLAQTAVDGTYRLDQLPAGAYVLEAALDTRDRAQLAGTSVAGDALTGRDLVIAVTRNATVSGVVRFPDGTPAAAPVVTLDGRGVQGAADGTFTLTHVPVSASPQTILAYTPDGRQGRASVLVAHSGQTVAGVVITLSGVGTLDVTVIDAAGQPVPHQQVLVTRAGTQMMAGGCLGVASGTTDGSGRLVLGGLEVGTVEIKAVRVAAGSADVATLATAIPRDGATATAVLRFSGAGTVAGTVVDDEGTPVFGADIVIESRRYEAGQCTLLTGESHALRTDVAGRFRATGVPVGPVAVRASQAFFPTPVGARAVLGRAGETVDVSLRLTDTMTGELSGRVWLPDATTPAGAGVRVTARGVLPDVVVSTDAEGRYRFARIFPEGNYTLTASDPATGGVTQTRVFLKAGQDASEDLRLLGRGTVRVRVVDGSGALVPQALVRLTETDFPQVRFEGVIEAATEGHLTFRQVHEGRLSVEASDAFGRGGRVAAQLPGPDALIEVTVPLTATGTVTGRFLWPDGTPIPFGTVRLLANGRAIGQTTTASGLEAGAFTFAYVPVGAVRLEALDPATGRAGVAVGSLAHDGEAVTLDVRAEGLGTVQGVVTSNGQPAPGARVDVAAGRFRTAATADASGAYVVPGVPEGAVTVTASLTTALQGVASATLAGDGTVLTIDVAVRASGTVEGTVTQADGVTPAPPAIVAIAVGAGGGTHTTTTDATGFYRLAHVPAGAATVTVDVLGSLDAVRVETEVVGAQTTTLPLRLLGVGTIEGVALEAADMPTGGTVQITGHGAVAYTHTLTAAADGTFRVPQVLAGPFTVRLTRTIGGVTLSGLASGTVEAGQVAAVAVLLQPSGTITGVIHRADGVTPALGADVTLRAGAVQVLVQAGADGRFTASGLPLGTYTLHVSDLTTHGFGRVLGIAMAAAGDVQEIGTLVLDDSAPVLVSLTPPDGTTGISRTSPIVLTFSDPLATTHGVEIRQGTTLVGTSKALSADGRALTLTGPWPDSAALTVAVTTGVTDVFGRRLATPVTAQLQVVDQSGPTVVGVLPAAGAVQVPLATAVQVTFSEPIVNGTHAGVVTLTSGSGSVPGSLIQTAPALVTFAPDAPLTADHVYTVHVTGATDASGNVQATAVSTTFATLDTVAPVLQPGDPAPGVWTTRARPTIRVTASDATSGLDPTTAVVRLDGQPLPTVVSGTTLVATPVADLAEGLHTVAASIADRAGHVGVVAPIPFGIDLTPPSVPTHSLTEGQVLSGQVPLTATASDEGSGVATIELRREGVVVLTLAAPSFGGTLHTTALAEGPGAITATAVDVAGHRGPASAPVTVRVDNHPVMVWIDAPAAHSRTRDTIRVTARTNEPVASVTVAVGAVSVTDATAPYDVTLDLAAVAEGAATITVTAHALDASTATATRAIVIDRTPPAAPDGTRITAEPPTLGVSVVRGGVGAVEAGATVEVRHLASGAQGTVAASTTGTFLTSVTGAIDDLLALVAIDTVGNRSAATLVAIRPTPSVPPVVGATTLRFEGLLADRVSAAVGAAGLVADTTPDAVFTATVDVGIGLTRQLAFVDLDGPAGARSTRGTSPVVGVAGEIGDPLANAADGTISGPVTGATSFTLFVADAGFLVEEGVYTVTFGFADGSRFVGSFTHVPPQDATAVAHAATITAIPGTTVVGTAATPGTATLQITNLRDLEGTRVPDGARIALAVASLASKDPTGVPIASAGGEILDGVPAANHPAFKVFEVVNGAVTATFSTGSVVPAPILGATTVVQLQAADAAGHVLGTHAVGTLDLNLRAPTDAAVVTAAQTTVYAEGRERRVPVTVQVPYADGTMLAVTAQATRAIANNAWIASAGGTIIGGAPSPSSGFQAFSVTAGRLTFEYSTAGAGTATRGQVRSAVVQVVPAGPTGAVSSQVALGTAVIGLVGPGAVEFQVARTSLPLVQPPQTTDLVVHHVHDARANLLPDGTEFLVTADANRTLVGSAWVPSAGGTILNGPTSPSSGFKRFVLDGGRFVVSYTTDPVTASPGQVRVAHVQVAQAGASGAVLSQAALGVQPVQLVAPLHALGSASPASLLADGGVHTSTVTFGPILDGFGNVVPDGTRLVATAAASSAFANGAWVPSAGGQIVDGDPSPSGTRYKAFTVQDGQVTITYADQNVTQPPGGVATANVALLPGRLDGAYDSQTALGVVPVALAGLTTATVTASPAALYADGADRRSVVTITNLRDALGAPVPDGTTVVVTAASSGSIVGGAYVASAGGQILGGTQEPGAAATHRVFPVQNGQVVVEYSSLGASVSATSERVAVVQVLAASPDGRRLSYTALGTAAIRLVPLGSAAGAATPPALVADGGDRRATVVLTHLLGADGVTPMPDGARVAITAESGRTLVSGAYVSSAGGDVLAADHAPGDGAVAPNSPPFRVFTVSGGEVRVTYRVPVIAGGVSYANVARVQVVPADAAGNILTTQAVAVVPIPLHGVTSTTASGPASAALSGGPVQVTFGGIKDAAGNTVPDGYLVAVTAAANKTRNEFNVGTASVGGTITDGTTSTVDPAFRVFPVLNGAVTVTFQPMVTGVATIQIAPLKADGTFVSQRALVGGWFPLTVTP